MPKTNAILSHPQRTLNMDHRLLDANRIPGPSRSPSSQTYFLSDDASSDHAVTVSDDIEDINVFLSWSSLHKLHLECYDECVFNDLPQYLIRISDMRLYTRGELWKVFRPLVDNITINLEKARHTMESAGEVKLREDCKDDIKRRLRYAIFSHRWGDEEPEFRDMSSKVHGQRSIPQGLGYQKLQRFCEKAMEYECEYVWSDTCCINKESSSELEEAIRSMYRWYRDAFVCIVYLAKSSSVKDFPREPWFTRGWTLQELLAPARLRMYGKDWHPVCPKSKDVQDPDFPFPNDKLSDFMLHAISKVTHIYHINIRDFNRRSPNLLVATKMRWASKRKTTRTEDVAYCLLGIFDIMMPIAYGEGERAFQRLLEAIAQRSGDPSFFAWAGPSSRHSLALPSSPASYQTVVSKPYCKHDYAILKSGIQLKLLVIQVNVVHSDHNHYVLEPMDSTLARTMTIIGRFVRSPNAELNPEHVYAIGVVDFQFEGSLGAGSPDMGSISSGKCHFGIFVRIARGRVGAGVELACRRIDTKSILPLIECKVGYQAVLKTALLEHTRFLFI